MNDFSREFGFLHPELVFKTHEFVRAYHKAHGSGWLFVRRTHIRAARTIYLSGLERRIVTEGKIFWIALGCIFVSVMAVFLLSIWFVVFSIIAVIFSFFLYRRIEFHLIQDRSLIIAMEMLSLDFAGWGTLFPSAKDEADEWLKSMAFGIEGKLLDTYMPSTIRTDFVDPFRPSEGSARSAAVEGGGHCHG
jgi:hypothetical protein